MFTRRAAMFSAAAAALMLAMPAFAVELNLPRQKVDLVAPPFVHRKVPRSWSSSS